MLCSLFSANGMPVPELSVKPFVKYGVGIFKVQGEKAMVDIGTQSGTVNKGKSIIGCIGEPEQWLWNESSRQKSLSDKY